ncbi:diguanylate cyclase response regulator [Fervidobacterium thailandense]|uniref:Diguanylate cyclase response regulator n=2 Tax=Fervidobacterium thailandense TaxID=1008305 RepID=A0A1E3G1V7_9BACT|nr:diguanylate cyclase response regulator [Fervidobacterium thailandense]
MVLESILTKFGCKVYVAEDALNGIEQALKVFPEAIVTDYNMPGLSGLQLCLYLRSLPAFAEVGIAVLTGSDDVINEFWAFNSGATKFISKLLPKDQLERELEDFLSRTYKVYPEKSGYIRSVYDVLEQKMRIEVLNKRILSLVQYARDESYVVGQLKEFISLFSRLKAVVFLLISTVEGRIYNFGFPFQKQILKQKILAKFEKPLEPSTWTYHGTYGAEIIDDEPDVFVVSYEGNEIGAIAFYGATDVRGLYSVLNDSSESLSLLFNTMNMIRELKVASSVDNLTGLLNKKEILRFLDEVHSTSKVQETSYYVAMMDIDNFKKINDTYGHLVGDEILKGVGKIIRENLPQGAVAGRYGGEEFTIVFTRTNKDIVMETMKRILETVRNTRFGEVGCTISGGVVSSSTYSSPTEVLKAADDLLYLAKKSGKNRVLYAFIDEADCGQSRLADVSYSEDSTKDYVKDGHD